LKILVTNDEDIYAEGLWVLVRNLKQVGQVVVVAPDREQSAAGTSVTLHHPLRVNKVVPLVKGTTAYSIEGTPADSVILALGLLIDDGVDLVVSGINEGLNLGNDVLISGTVAAALHAHIRGIPSMALSVAGLENFHLDAAAKLGGLLAEKFANNALPKELFLNINLPNLPIDEIPGIEVTRLAGQSYVEEIKEGHDGKRKYYWIVRGKAEWEIEEGTDTWAISKGMISITPLQSDLTGASKLPTLERLSSFLFQHLSRSGG